MTRSQLEHAIRAACDVTDDNELWVFGSQAILATDPNPPSDLVASIEVDVQPKNKPEAVDKIDGVLGELSMFFDTHHFYVQGVLMDGLVLLPEGWQDRTIPVHDPMSGGNKTGYCLDVHDLTISKMCAFRQKDLDFVRSLFVHEMVVEETLKSRLARTHVEEELRMRVLEWLRITGEDLNR